MPRPVQRISAPSSETTGRRTRRPTGRWPVDSAAEIVTFECADRHQHRGHRDPAQHQRAVPPQPAGQLAVADRPVERRQRPATAVSHDTTGRQRAEQIRGRRDRRGDAERQTALARVAAPMASATQPKLIASRNTPNVAVARFQASRRRSKRATDEHARVRQRRRRRPPAGSSPRRLLEQDPSPGERERDDEVEPARSPPLRRRRQPRIRW